MPLDRKVGLAPSDIVLDMNSAPPPQRGQNPQFLVHVYCGQTAGWIKMPLAMAAIGLGPGHIVLDGDPAPIPKRGHSPQFSAHFYCGQTAGCIKIPLGMEVSLSPGHIVPDADPATPPKRHHRSSGDSLVGKGGTIRSVLCNIVCNNCTQCDSHTYEQTNSSLDWVLSHWAHFTVIRFIFVLCITVCCIHA